VRTPRTLRDGPDYSTQDSAPTRSGTLTGMPYENPYPGNTAWPSAWEGSRLTGRFVDILGQPLAGTVTFTPAPAAVLVPTQQVIVLPAPRVVTLVAGAFDVVLPATDDPDGNPTGWTYTVAEGVPGGRSYAIEAPRGVSQDLSQVAPVPSSAGDAVVRGPAGPSAYETALEQGFVGTEAQWLASLEGPTGPAGPQGADGDIGPQGPTGSTGPGVATGGSTGQALVKASATNYDTAWAAVAAELVNGKGVVRQDELALNMNAYVSDMTGTTDMASALQSALNTAAAFGLEVIGHGVIRTDAMVSVPASSSLRLRGVTIKPSVAAQTCLTVGARASIEGGVIESPATFDGTNVAWTYAVVLVSGADASIQGLHLVNVPKVGIGVREVHTARVSNCIIEGNYPSASWTGVETVHFGISVDPGSTADLSGILVTGNVVRSCVQGFFAGNYGGGVTCRGITVTGNTFATCWNHGVYGSVGIAGANISDNTFVRCQIPVAVTGSHHVVSDNTMTTSGTGDQRDITGISVRDPIGCSITGNTVQGDAPTGSVIIDVRELAGVVCRDNIVADNIIDVAGGSSTGIRVGAGSATTHENNRVSGNRIRSIGSVGSGLITLAAAGSGFGIDNAVTDNSVVILGNAHGIRLSRQQNGTVRGNKVRLAYDAPSATTLSGVELADSSYCQVDGNSVLAPAAWGTNVTLRGVTESGSSGSNRIERNQYRFDLTKLAAGTPIVLAGASTTWIDEHGTGIPALAAAVGSQWHRTDSAGNDALYVKELAGTAWTPVGSTDLEFMSSLGNNVLAGYQASASQTHPTINYAITVRFKPSRNLAVSELAWFTGTATSGNYDIGVYSAAGARLWSLGSTAWPTTSIRNAVAVTGLTLTAGTEYLLAFAGDNTTGTWRGLAEAITDQVKMLNGTFLARIVAAAFPLPSSITPGASRSAKIPLITVHGTAP
jgi:Right handed beta helix region/Periplasmic copper-binding protein (NosD)